MLASEDDLTNEKEAVNGNASVRKKFRGKSILLFGLIAIIALAVGLGVGIGL